MPALSALPDHEVIRALLPEALETHLDRGEAAARIAANPGLLPVAVDPMGRGKVFWADIGDHPLREWQFTYTMQHLVEARAIKSAFTTDFDIFEDDTIGADGIEPSGLIFHVSRCGSTLMAKALARLDSNIVVNQGTPLQRGFWARLTDDFRRPLEPSPENLQAFRRLVLAMTRRRSPAHTTAFVKLVSWNTLYFDFIRQAFPGVPLLFLYRDPVEVIASVIQRPVPALLAKGSRQGALLVNDDNADTSGMTDLEYLARCTAQYMKAALKGTEAGLKVLNYSSVTPENFATILECGLSFNPGEDELAVMREQFKYHSKDDKDSKEFQVDNAEKSKTISDADKAMIRRICGDLVERLDRSPANLFP